MGQPVKKQRRKLSADERTVRALRSFGAGPLLAGLMTAEERAAFAAVVNEVGDLVDGAKAKFDVAWHKFHDARKAVADPPVVVDSPLPMVTANPPAP